MAFQQGLSGLNAASAALNVISNNVANTDTVGFKTGMTQFADVFAAALNGAVGGIQIGSGTTVDAVHQRFTQGNITTTGNALDVAINGSGFFRMDQNGSIAYSRNGQFEADKDGFIVNAQGFKLTGYGVDANGNILPAAPTDIQINTADVPPKVTSTVDMGLNLDSQDTVPTTAFAASDPTSYNYSTSVTIYDSLGNDHIMSLYFVKTGGGTWDVHQELDGGGTSAAMSLTFDTSGNLTGTTSAALSLVIPASFGAATPQAVTLDFAGSTQYGKVSVVNSQTQDGYASGSLSGIAITPEGIVQGRYSNGQSRNLGQVVLANFAAPQGLVSLGNNLWAESPSSGQALIGAPKSGSLGALTAGSVEDSNTDLTAELVAMITQQRAYQANAQTIKTEDQIMQTLVNLR